MVVVFVLFFVCLVVFGVWVESYEIILGFVNFGGKKCDRF